MLVSCKRRALYDFILRQPLPLGAWRCLGASSSRWTWALGQGPLRASACGSAVMKAWPCVALYGLALSSSAWRGLPWPAAETCVGSCRHMDHWRIVS